MWIIAKNTIKEFIRNKLLYVIVTVGIWLIFFSLVLSTLALSEEKKIILDFSLTTIEMFWLVTTLFLGSYLFYNELNKNTILLILSKNPYRTNFVLWKFLWFAALIALIYLILTVSFFVVLFLNSIAFDISYFFAVFLSYIKIMVVLSFIIFFSVFVSPFVVLLATLAIYIISHMTWFLKFYILREQDISFWGIGELLVNVIYYVFPNFQDLSMKEYLLSPALWDYTFLHIGLSTFSSLLYMFILLAISVIIFKRKEI